MDSAQHLKEVVVTTTIKGNSIYATEKDNWEHVDAVAVGEEKFYFRIEMVLVFISIRLSPTRRIKPSFQLPSVQNTSIDSNRAAHIHCASIRLLAEREYVQFVPYVQPAASAASDSDDEGPPDFEIPSVFNDNELFLMMTQHRKLYTLFNQARRVHFENAYGKLFFMAFCELLLPNLECLISTNPKGLHQPGSLCVKWVTPGKDTSGSAVIETAQDRVADFVVVNRVFILLWAKSKV